MKEQGVKGIFWAGPKEKMQGLSLKQRERRSGFVRLARMLGKGLMSIALMWVSKRLPGVLPLVPGVLYRLGLFGHGRPGARHSFPRDDLEWIRSRE